jgi:flagellar biosynthetic protein FliP
MNKKIIRLLFVAMLFSIILSIAAGAVETDNIFPSISVNIGGEDNGGSSSLQILFLITILSLLPSILIMMTSFTRIIIVLSFIRNALGLQQTPPNQILVGLALLLSLFIMSPVINEINENAYSPYVNGEITQKAALEKAVVPIRSFMLKQTKNEEMKLFLSLSKDQLVQSIDDVKFNVVIAAFITSEMKRAFTIGFLIFIPFLIIDMVVASVLMSMGMMMLPPVMISLPFKVMLFVLVDGWGLIIKTLVLSFH